MKDMKVIFCWRCHRSALVDMNTVKRDARGRPLFTCRVCTMEIERLDRK